MPSSVFRGPENLARVSLEFSPCENPICFSRSAAGVVDLGGCARGRFEVSPSWKPDGNYVPLFRAQGNGR